VGFIVNRGPCAEMRSRRGSVRHGLRNCERLSVCLSHHERGVCLSAPSRAGGLSVCAIVVNGPSVSQWSVCVMPRSVRASQEMKRALFLYAKLNPGLTYVQGMNELYAPLYYLFRNDVRHGASQHAEADAFFCFVDLVSEFRDHFCQQLVSAGCARLAVALGPLHLNLCCRDRSLLCLSVQ
jgi:Rab-GTPase-TBC domain